MKFKSSYGKAIEELDKYLLHGVAFRLECLKEMFCVRHYVIIRHLMNYEYEFEPMSEFGEKMWVKRPSPVFDGIKMRDMKCLNCMFGILVNDEECECRASSPSADGKFPMVRKTNWCACFMDYKTHKQPLRRFVND